MLDMKTTSWGGGSHAEFIKRAILSNKTPLNSKVNHNKVDLLIAKFKKIFVEMGYFVPASLSACHWVNLLPKSNPDLFPPLKVYISEDFQSFYALNILTGALEFYSFSGSEPDYCNDSIFEKLRFGGVA